MFPNLEKWRSTGSCKKYITLAFSIYNSVEVNPVSIAVYLDLDALYRNSNYLNRYS